jgi:ferrous iron transport protein B
MTIFFPLFTILEDLGYLPRIAFNLDRGFCRCHACGKQALTMCMGLGCNAVGVTGCRIIDSPRERRIAMLTNSMMPCNGRFPTLIALITLFVVTGNGILGSLGSSLTLICGIVLCVVVALLCSRLLSATLLRGEPSSFVLELPPYRMPRVGQVIVRSVLDRTLFVLGRAVAVAAPAGLVLWLLANINVGDMTLLAAIASALDPVGRVLGMDGVILLAFILSLPANEIFVPIMMMIYRSGGVLEPLGSMSGVREILISQGWTTTTAVCVMLFLLFHWPCATTLWTIKKESGGWRWVLLGTVIPTLVGVLLCLIAATVSRLFT